MVARRAADVQTPPSRALIRDLVSCVLDTRTGWTDTYRVRVRRGSRWIDVEITDTDYKIELDPQFICWHCDAPISADEPAAKSSNGHAAHAECKKRHESYLKGTGPNGLPLRASCGPGEQARACPLCHQPIADGDVLVLPLALPVAHAACCKGFENMLDWPPHRSAHGRGASRAAQRVGRRRSRG